jgi:hypothetical protein
MYRLSPLEYRELEKQVTEFLKDGILETCIPESLWCSCLVCAEAQWARLASLCRLNSITVKNRCTIPRIDNMLDAVAGSAYFTSLDLNRNTIRY